MTPALPKVVYFTPHRNIVPGIAAPTAYKPIAYRPAKKGEYYYFLGSTELHRALPNPYPLPVVIVKRIQNQKEEA